MGKNKKLLFLSVLLFTMFCHIVGANPADNLAKGGNAQVDLDFEVRIPSILFLRIGSSGATVDQITFSVADAPGTGAVPQNEPAVTGEVSGFVSNGSTMTLSVDSSNPMTDGKDNIPFDEISWSATGDFTSGTFNSGAAQKLDVFTGSGNNSGTYTFSYENDTYYPAADYSGRVTYTLSSP